MSFILLDTIQLPSWLLWEDQHSWRPYVRTVERSVAGAAVITDFPLLAGQPITLSGLDNSGWIRRSTGDALATLAATALLEMTLTFPDARGTHTVMFSTEDDALDLRPVLRKQVEDTDWLWIAAIRLIKV